MNKKGIKNLTPVGIALFALVCIIVIVFIFALIKSIVPGESDYLNIYDCGDYVTLSEFGICNVIGSYTCTGKCEAISSENTKSNYVVIYDEEYILYNYKTKTKVLNPFNGELANLTKTQYETLKVIANDTKIFGYLVDTSLDGIYDYYSYETGELLYENETTEDVTYEIDEVIAGVVTESTETEVTTNDGYLLVHITDNGFESSLFINLTNGMVEETLDYYYSEY